MAKTREEIRATFPMPAYNFRVSRGAEVFGCKQVSGLTMQYDTITYKHGLSWSEGAYHLPGMLQPVNITLEKGIIRKGSMMLNWITSIRMNEVDRHDLTIDLCDEEGNSVVSWRVTDAFPTQLEAPTFDAETSQVAFERISLMASSVQISYHQTEEYAVVYKVFPNSPLSPPAQTVF